MCSVTMHSSSFYWPLGLDCVQQNHIFALSIKIGSVQLNSAWMTLSLSQRQCHSVSHTHKMGTQSKKLNLDNRNKPTEKECKLYTWPRKRYELSRMIADSQLACFNEKKIWQKLHILDAHANFTIYQVSLSGEESLAVRAITGSQHSQNFHI